MPDPQTTAEWIATSPAPALAVLCLVCIGLAGACWWLVRENRRITNQLIELTRECVQTNNLLLERLR